MSTPIILETAGTYTRGVKAILLNRILVILSFVGLFVAGALSIEKALNISLPCGNQTGCDMVASHPSSYIFGIPVAYIGLAGYLLLAGLAISRTIKTPYDTRLVTIGLAASVIGAIFSIYLQFISLTKIHAICPYCMTSAITMILTVIVYIMLYKAHLADPTPETEMSKLDLYLVAGVPFLIVVTLGMLGNADKSGTKLDIGNIELNEKELIPENANVYGPADAKMTIVEFADMCCPSCQMNEPKLKEFATTNPKTVKIVFREFPLSIHKYGKTAAAMGEYAAEKHKFWDFTFSVMDLQRQPESIDELLGIARSVGLDPDDIRKRLSDPKDAVYDRVARDMNLAHTLKINSTPTFIILAPGQRPDSAGPTEVFDKLNGPAYKSILLGHG